MKQLITSALILLAIFASTFFISRITGVLTVEDIKSALTKAFQVNLIYVAMTVTLLLFIDLFIAIPSLTMRIFSGHFPGAITGGASGAIIAAYAGSKSTLNNPSPAIFIAIGISVVFWL
ncbi:MAG: hypothetical protein K0Q67_3170, partial [Cellvibrio sp.]|nr:hypothetical protein [Cellvibrio sp.]